MNTIKIERKGVKAEVVAQDLNTFIADGWKVSSNQGEKHDKENPQLAEAQQVLDDAKAALDAAEALREQNEAAEARIEAGVRDFELEQERITKQELKSNANHTDAISRIEDKDELVEYIKQNFDKDLDKRGSLESVKLKAIAITKEV